MNLAGQFLQLFAGLDRAYGTYVLDGRVTDKGKAEGVARTVYGQVTPDLWHAHLTGEKGLGIVPIRDDNKCVFGTIDVDEYNLDIEALAHRSDVLGLPLIVCRSKSGGAHMYLFLSEPVSCKQVRRCLLSMAVALGHPKAEIFPKQENLANKNDVGNWINMPYFDASRTTRYAIKDNVPLSAEAFLALADERKVSREELLKINVTDDSVLEEAPPCLQVLCANGVPEGGRNEVLFSLGVYARNRYGEGWEKHFDSFNQQFMNPPLGYKELAVLAKQVGRKDYYYKCDNAPLNRYCNKDVCRHRKFGIGDEGNDDPGVIIDSLTKINCDPPIWIVSVNGHRMQMSTAELMSQVRFGTRCVETLLKYPDAISKKRWQRMINKLLSNAEVIDAPEDAGPTGQFKYHLEQFCTTKAQARTRDELLMGKPWTENGRTFFRSNDLIKYLEQQKFRDYNSNQCFAILKDSFEVEHEQFKIKGKCVRCWSVPEFVKQEEDFEPARISESEF